MDVRAKGLDVGSTAFMNETVAAPSEAARVASRNILLINPNSSADTTAMMVSIARSTDDRFEIIGATATRAPSMIVDVAALAASAAEVVKIGACRESEVSGIIVSAFGDPGVTGLRSKVGVPVVGIAEASMIEAAGAGRRFGVATTTPGLAGAIDARAADLGFGHLYTGVRLTPGDPHDLVANPARLVDALGLAVSDCIERDDAEAVIIGGGPLGNAAAALIPRFGVPIIAPIPAAVRLLAARLSGPIVQERP